MRILIAGPAGSGKTTQAKFIALKLNICFFGAGEIFRKKSLANNETGKSLKKDLEEGNLIDNKVAARLLKEEVEKNDCPNGFVFDGYPRDMDQLQYFDPKFDKVIVLEVAEEILVKRLLIRGRFDDTRKAILERLKIYQDETSQVINHYAKIGIVLKINGDKSIEEVSLEIAKKLYE